MQLTAALEAALWGCATRISPAEQLSWPHSTHRATGTWAPSACWKRTLADVDTVTLCCPWTTDHRGMRVRGLACATCLACWRCNPQHHPAAAH